MDSYKELQELAAQAGCAQIVDQARQQAELLLQQNQTNIVITGGNRSGRIRLINQLVGFEVRDEESVADGEKPLRVAFEPLPDDPRYTCQMAANRHWHNEAAVFHELEAEQILQEGRHTGYLENMDVVFYLISARAPFSSDQVKDLDALKPLKRFVILTGLDTVAQKDREQVLAYVNRFIDALKLPPVIVWKEEAQQDPGRALRNLLPAYDELQNLRRMHNVYNRRRIVMAIRDQVTALLEENSRRRAEAAARQEQLTEAARREKLEWTRMHAELRDMHAHADDTILMSLDRSFNGLIQKIIQSGRSHHCSGEWKEKTSAHLQKKQREFAEKYASQILETYTRDISALSNNAKMLRLSRYREEDFSRLVKKAEGSLSPAPMKWEPSRTAAGSGSSVDKTKVLFGTGAVVGFFALAPLSLPTSILGIVGGVGVGAAYYKKISDEELLTALEAALKEWRSAFRQQVGAALNEIYSDARMLLREKSENGKNGLAGANGADFEENTAALNRMVQRCDELLCE